MFSDRDSGYPETQFNQVTGMVSKTYREILFHQHGSSGTQPVMDDALNGSVQIGLDHINLNLVSILTQFTLIRSIIQYV